jgi:hypothetical protein
MIRETLRFVRRSCTALPAQHFGPKRLKEIRQAMIEVDHSRRYINKNIGRIKRMFRWAVEEELIPPTMHTALETVRGLKRGRTTARETERTLRPVFAKRTISAWRSESSVFTWRPWRQRNLHSNSAIKGMGESLSNHPVRWHAGCYTALRGSA